MKKVILYDLDGTIIDSTDAIVDTFYYTFEKIGFNYNGSKEQIIKQIGYPLEIMYKNLGIEDSIIDDIVLMYKLQYRTISKAQTSLLYGAIQSLEFASKNAILAIVTTKTTKYTIPLLEHLDIIKYFKVIVGRQEVTNPKPHPEPIFKAMELLNIDNSYDIWMIGDTKLDLIAAKEAGVKSVGVLSGYGTKDELELYSSYVVDNVLEATKICVG